MSNKCKATIWKCNKYTLKNNKYFASSVYYILFTNKHVWNNIHIHCHNLITKLLLIISYLTKSHIWRIFALATRWSINRRLRVVRHAVAIVIPIGSVWRICIIVVIFYWMMSVFTTWKWVSFICKINEIFVII